MATDLWVGGLMPVWTDEFVKAQVAALAPPGHVSNVKVMRDHTTNLNAGYGFAECSSHEAAVRVMEALNGKPIGDTGHVFRVNWGKGAGTTTGGGGGGGPAAGESSIFVGDLPYDVTEDVLHATFAAHFPSLSSVKIMMEPETGQSKGYGFVRFKDPNDAMRAISEMNGQMCGTRPMRVSEATPRRTEGGAATMRVGGGVSGMVGLRGEMPPPVGVNTTVFVGGVGDEITEEMLRALFEPLGPVWKVNLLRDKSVAFVEYSFAEHAQIAIETLNGFQLGASRLRLDWGKAANKGNPMAAAMASMMYAPYDPYAMMYAGYYGGAAFGMPAAAMAAAAVSAPAPAPAPVKPQAGSVGCVLPSTLAFMPPGEASPVVDMNRLYFEVTGGGVMPVAPPLPESKLGPVEGTLLAP